MRGRNKDAALKLITNEKERMTTALAYFDSETAYRELNDYFYNISVSPIPFVGSAPTPVKRRNKQINSMHLLAEKEVAIPKPKMTYRIFLIGNSTALCPGASSHDNTIGGCLQKLAVEFLAEVNGMRPEVFTAACSGWASTHERIFAENIISGLQPDLVISFSGNNEAHYAWNHKNIMWFRN